MKNKSVVEGWTQSRYNSFIKGGLRRLFSRYPNKYVALKNAEKGRIVNASTGRLAKHYQCSICKKLYPSKEVEVDHIIPLMKDAKNWDDVVRNMFCATEQLQVLCKTCHKAKTNEERKLNGKRKSVL